VVKVCLGNLVRDVVSAVVGGPVVGQRPAILRNAGGIGGVETETCL
jgi:hypothetical protein